MNRRNKRTSYYQYEVYLDFMEGNPLMSANKLGRTQDSKKWKELSDELNKCTVGPNLAPEEWRKRLNDWKNSTRAKFRRSLSSDDKSNILTPLENRALQIFSSESIYRDVTAPVDIKELAEEHADQEEPDEGQEEVDEEQEQYQEFISPPENATRTVINGHRSGKQLRLQDTGEIIYQVSNIVPSERSAPKVPAPAISCGKKIEQQLKRISDIEEASLHFKIACFKYNNPGFDYDP
ncbi:uncharacterized protein LOC119550004 [Drosophila subpulchrella]|uniref:uncharacterized protein LOC119550004 n=1 Tax=Drosophila subpulchrella TaxID=1486046 RepID=UPI0018A1A649|nr:uncharacterized protein LOC119550004 [Drosophila subpulchrella]